MQHERSPAAAARWRCCCCCLGGALAHGLPAAAHHCCCRCAVLLAQLETYFMTRTSMETMSGLPGEGLPGGARTGGALGPQLAASGGSSGASGARTREQVLAQQWPPAGGAHTLCARARAPPSHPSACVALPAPGMLLSSGTTSGPNDAGGLLEAPPVCTIYGAPLLGGCPRPACALHARPALRGGALAVPACCPTQGPCNTPLRARTCGSRPCAPPCTPQARPASSCARARSRTTSATSCG